MSPMMLRILAQNFKRHTVENLLTILCTDLACGLSYGPLHGGLKSGTGMHVPEHVSFPTGSRENTQLPNLQKFNLQQPSIVRATLRPTVLPGRPLVDL